LQWCTCGSLEKLIDPNGNAISWERDAQGRVTRAIRADGSDTAATYESTTSRLKQIRDPRQQVSTLQYFADNNWKQVTYTNTQQTTPSVTHHDPAYRRLATITDGLATNSRTTRSRPPSLGAARLVSVDRPLANDVVTSGYDELGQMRDQASWGG
jgi:YD repeat-containing protein